MYLDPVLGAARPASRAAGWERPPNAATPVSARAAEAPSALELSRGGRFAVRRVIH